MKAINNQTNAEKSLGKLPVWRLADLYISQNDKKLFIDLNNIKKETKKFEKKYLNKVKFLSAERLLDAIVKLEESINELNQEGRERLLDAFEKVNRKFDEVYTKLFNGGSAKH